MADARGQTVILSPHCDDACLSLGGALQATSLGVLPHVAIVFSVSCYTRDVVYSGQTERITAVRMAEEREAATRGQYEPSFWGFPEPLVRAGFSGLEDIRRPERAARADSAWPAVSAAIARHLAAHRGLVLLPMGCGDHIDHAIVRDAALDYLEDAAYLDYGLFEDLPYAGWAPPESCETIARRVARRPLAPVRLKTMSLRHKRDLLSCYHTQLNDDDLASVQGHWQRVGGERLWLTTCATARFVAERDALSDGERMSLQT